MKKRQLTLASLLLLILVCTIYAHERPLILITNDDGIESPGLKALALELTKLGDVVIAAPKNNRSGVGHGITYRVPIAYGRSDSFPGIIAWWVDALPATCVRWALDTRLGGRNPDLVVSGINNGSNLGDAVYYSGTIGAAREAALTGSPAIAVSMESGRDMDLAGAARLVKVIAEKILKMENPPRLLNVNFPKGKIDKETKLRLTRLTKARWRIVYHDRVSPRGGNYFWITFDEGVEPEAGSDAEAVKSGAVSITPLFLDLTMPERMEALRKAVSR